jgi:hypothetical protein
MFASVCKYNILRFELKIAKVITHQSQKVQGNESDRDKVDSHISLLPNAYINFSE